MHRSCAARYFLRLSNTGGATTNKKCNYPCPTCKKEWNKNDVDSVLKSTTINDENNARQSTGIVNKKQRTSRANGHNNTTNTRSSNRRIADDSDDD
jgi:hypothetical protein